MNGRNTEYIEQGDGKLKLNSKGVKSYLLGSSYSNRHTFRNRISNFFVRSRKFIIKIAHTVIYD